MRIIDLETWPRRVHFIFYKDMGMPHFSLTANVDITAFYPVVKQREISFTLAFLYLITCAANVVREFRLRIQGDQLVEYEVVHPATTILVEDDLFGFAFFEYDEDFSKYHLKALETIEVVKTNPELEDPPDVDKYLFTTSIPWVSFTNMMHPISLFPTDSVPRLAWGKYFEQGDRLLMPLGVQAHHAVMDGLHMGRYFIKVQEYLDTPEEVLGNE
jgi:chloramphenicol O-acetyltransferase type A